MGVIFCIVCGPAVVYLEILPYEERADVFCELPPVWRAFDVIKEILKHHLVYTPVLEVVFVPRQEARMNNNFADPSEFSRAKQGAELTHQLLEPEFPEFATSPLPLLHHI